MSIEWRSAL